MEKAILVIGSTSELAQRTIKELQQKNWTIYATSRQVNLIENHVNDFQLDVQNEMNFLHLRERFANLKFDVIINFAGIAIAGAVEELNELELKKQLDINLYGLLRIIKYFCPSLAEGGRLINVSSMASYGIFPFLSPYCLSKASADILLNSYSVESGVKVVSIRPGAVATKFWENSINLNADTLNDKSTKFEKEKEFLVKNAERNTLKATNPIYVAKKIVKIIEHKNPKEVYNIGLDSKLVKLTRFLPTKLTNFIVKQALKARVAKNDNEKN